MNAMILIGNDQRSEVEKEMERDSIITHGASFFLKERLFDMSDPYTVPVCATCGSMDHISTNCKHCENDKVKQFSIPYACKLLFQDLQAMGIKVLLK